MKKNSFRLNAPNLIHIITKEIEFKIVYVFNTVMPFFMYFFNKLLKVGCTR